MSQPLDLRRPYAEWSPDEGQAVVDEYDLLTDAQREIGFAHGTRQFSRRVREISELLHSKLRAKYPEGSPVGHWQRSVSSIKFFVSAMLEKSTSSQIKRLKLARESVKRSLVEEHHQLAAVRAELKAKADALAQSDSRYRDLESLIVKKVSELSLREMELQEKVKELAQKEAELAATILQLSKMKEELGRLQQQLREKEGMNQRLDQQNRALQADLERKDKAEKALSLAMQLNAREYQKLEESQVQKGNDINTLQERVSSLQKDNDILEERLEAVQQEKRLADSLRDEALTELQDMHRYFAAARLRRSLVWGCLQVQPQLTPRSPRTLLPPPLDLSRPVPVKIEKLQAKALMPAPRLALPAPPPTPQLALPVPCSESSGSSRERSRSPRDARDPGAQGSWRSFVRDRRQG